LALTKRRQLFVHEYCADPKANGTAAAVKAGFNEKRAKITACELLKDPEIKAAIEHKMKQRLEKVSIGPDLVLTGLLETIELCLSAGAGSWQTSGLIKCYELLGKHLGMFKERIELGVDEAILAKLIEGRERARRSTPLNAAEAEPLTLEASNGGN
jgi:phage terminase small subunit